MAGIQYTAWRPHRHLRRPDVWHMTDELWRFGGHVDARGRYNRHRELYLNSSAIGSIKIDIKNGSAVRPYLDGHHFRCEIYAEFNRQLLQMIAREP